jgi:hypothetical protein
MKTKVGVGYSESPDSKKAGIEAAQIAMQEAKIDSCNLALLFATSKQDPVLLSEGVRSVIGSDSRLIGGYALGIITKDFLAYEGYQVGIVVMKTESIIIDMFIEKGLSDNEFNTGVALGNQIRNKKYKGEPNILLMYDSIKEMVTEGLSLNMATPLLQGMKQSLEDWPRMGGVGMMGDWNWNPTYQWFDNRIEQNTAMALVLSGNVRMDTIIMHGCKPSSNYRTITKAEGNIVLEIDNKPAVEMIADLLGPDSDKGWEDYPLFVTLGVNKGDKFGEFKEDEYASRLCMAIDKERGGLVMFENDLTTGSEIQLMRRAVDVVYVGQRSEELLKRIGDRKPIFAVYINCAGRAKTYSGTEREDGEEVQRVIGSKMPLLGMYSGVEIAKVGDDMQALDWTGVLCLFSEE